MQLGLVNGVLGSVSSLCVIWLKICMITSHMKKTRVEIGTGSKIPLQKALFQIRFWGHISATDQGIFTKFDV